MPAATTHVEFARDVYHALKNPSFVDDGLFYLGSQGPDLFFFSRASGLLPGSLKNIGNQMHDEKVEEVLNYLYQYSRLNPLLKNYYYGYLCHYALDSECHPLIVYYAKKEHEETGISEYEAHVTAEACIDIWALRKHRRTADTYNVFEDLKVNRKEAKELAHMYERLFADIFQVKIGAKKIEETITSIYYITKWLKPTSARKYEIAHNVETKLGIPRLVTSMMLYQKSDEDLEVLNEAHNPYTMYGQNDCVATSSFAELYDKALQNATTWIQQDTPPKELKLDFLGSFIKQAK